MADKPWKAMERRVATYFGGKRVPVLGDEARADVNHEDLFIECKLMKSPSIWTLWETVKKRAKKEDKAPVVCIQKGGCKGFLIVVHSDDLAKL